MKDVSGRMPRMRRMTDQFNLKGPLANFQLMEAFLLHELKIFAQAVGRRRGGLGSLLILTSRFTHGVRDYDPLLL